MASLQKIIAKRPEIAKRIYDTYPTTKMERKGCEREKARLDFLRLTMAKRLIAEGTIPTGKQEYQ